MGALCKLKRQFIKIDLKLKFIFLDKARSLDITKLGFEYNLSEINIILPLNIYYT